MGLTADTTPAAGQSPRQAAAQQLRAALASRSPVAPVRDLIGAVDADEAYAVQNLNTAFRLAQGQRLTGRKIGLTSKAVQAQLGVDQPDYGMLFADMAAPNGGRVPVSTLIQPKIEGEIAFVMAAGVDDPEAPREAVTAAVGHATAALEIVDSRIRDWDIRLADTIADNASSGLYVLGDDRVALSEVDLVACRMTLLANGAEVSTGSGAACLGDPLTALCWLARKMAAVGRPLQAGDVVLSGALGPMAPVAPGRRFLLSVDGFAPVECSFTGEGG